MLQSINNKVVFWWNDRSHPGPEFSKERAAELHQAGA
jgi:hypothetical protein